MNDAPKPVIDLTYDAAMTVLYVTDPEHEPSQIRDAITWVETMRRMTGAAGFEQQMQRDPTATQIRWNAGDEAFSVTVSPANEGGLMLRMTDERPGEESHLVMRGIGLPEESTELCYEFCVRTTSTELLDLAIRSLDWFTAGIQSLMRPQDPRIARTDEMLRGAGWRTLELLGRGDDAAIDVIAPTPWRSTVIWVEPQDARRQHRNAIDRTASMLDGTTPCVDVSLTGNGVQMGVHGIFIDTDEGDAVSRMRDIAAYEAAGRNDGR